MAHSLLDIQSELESSGASGEYREKVLAHARRLDAKGFPILFTVQDLAAAWSLNWHTYSELFRNSWRNYRTFGIRKRRGGMRFIMAPRPKLKLIQRWILSNILDEITLHPACMGFVSGRSISSNAELHAGSKLVLKMDLWKFFDSIHVRRVYGMFLKFGYTKEVAYDLSRICCARPSRKYRAALMNSKGPKEKLIPSFQGMLPQGAPTSPAIANTIAIALDKRLYGLAQSYGMRYTRYADDLTFSSDRIELPEGFVGRVRKIVLEEGFFVNEKKTSVRRYWQRQIITGLVSNEQPNIPKERLREIRKHLYFARKYGPLDHMKKVKWKSGDFQLWLNGQIAFVNTVRPELAKDMWAIFREINWIELTYPDFAISEEFHTGDSPKSWQ